MADKKKPSKPTKVSAAKTPKKAPDQEAQSAFKVQGQYITDLSFECPQPPASLGQFNNNMSLDVGVQSTPAGQEGTTETHEVTIVLRAHNKTDDGKTIYLFEMKYSGIFVLSGIPAEHKGGLLGVEAPALLYPFARQILMGTVAGSGFQAPLLEPINFAAIFMQQQQAQAQKVAAN